MSKAIARLVLIETLLDRLREITPANGYKNDMSDEKSVQMGRSIFDDSDPEVLLSVMEPPTSPEQLEAPNEVRVTGLTRLPLLIQGFTPKEPLNPTRPAYILMADVQRRLTEERSRVGPMGQRNILGLGGGVTDFQMQRGIVRPPTVEVSEGAFFWLLATVSFVETFDLPNDI